MKIHIISDGEFTGYGSVRLPVSCYLVMNNDYNFLIDTGIGNNNFYDRSRYDVKFPRQLISGLKDLCVEPEDINFVIHTHLHFDHSNGSFDADGRSIFKNAKYLIQETEWERMLSEEIVIRKNPFLMLNEDKKIEFLHGTTLIEGGIKLILCGGHTEGFQYATVNIVGTEHIFAGDIVPTVWHINNRNPEGIDFDKDKLLKVKSEILERCVEKKSVLYFQHSSVTRSSGILKYRDHFRTFNNLKKD